MNIYIWEYASPVSVAYHDGGGLLVVAKSLEEARNLWNERAADRSIVSAEEATEPEPDHVFPTSKDVEPQVLVFEDAGCC